jgi:hypothetical protein
MKSIQKVAKELDHLQTKLLQKYGSAEKTGEKCFQ